MAESLYEVTFIQPGEGPITLQVREISDSALGPMFVRISGFVFNHGLLVNPKLEAAERRFAKTRSLHLNRMAIHAVEEIEGAAISLTDPGPNVVQFRPPD